VCLALAELLQALRRTLMRQPALEPAFSTVVAKRLVEFGVVAHVQQLVSESWKMVAASSSSP